MGATVVAGWVGDGSRGAVRLHAIAWVACLSVCAGWAQTGEARLLAERVVRALRSARYSAERNVQLARGPLKVRHAEVVHKDGPRTRIEYLAGSPLEGTVVVEDGRRRYVVRPDGSTIEEGPTRGDFLTQRLEAVLADSEGFSLRVEAGQPVAGLPTRLLEVLDRRGGVAQRLWVHPQSGIVLRQEVYGPAGRALGGYELRRIELHPKFEPGLFDPPRSPSARTSVLARLLAVSREGGFLPAYLPLRSGFRIEALMVREIAGRKVLAQVYRGRRGLLTLYQLSPTGRPIRGLPRAPGLSLHAWEREGRSFVLIGDPPEEKLRELAASLVVR